MKAITVATPEAPARRSHRSRRARPYHRPVSFLYGAFLLAIAFVSFTGFLYSTTRLIMEGDRILGFWSLGLLTVFGLTRLLAFLHNRHLCCPLCHGPVLHEKRCRKHVEAHRAPGLSYRATAALQALQALITGTFRCMYCATDYRLKK